MTENGKTTSEMDAADRFAIWIEEMATKVEGLTSKVEDVHECLATHWQDYLSIQQAAELTGLSARHINRQIQAGELNCANFGSPKRRRYRIARSDIATWYSSKTVLTGSTKSQRKSKADNYWKKDVATPVHSKGTRG